MVGEQYIKHFKIIRENYVIYETKKMYFDNNVKLSNKALVFIILFPIFYIITMVMIGLFFNLSSSAIAGIFLVGILIFTLLIILIACVDYQRTFNVHLFLDQKNEKITLTADTKEYVFYHPKQIHIAIHEYPIYSREGKYQPIILIVFDLINHHQNLDLNDSEKLRLASIQCNSVLEAKMIYSEVINTFNPLLMWLNLEITHEQEVIKHERFFYLK